MAQHSLPLSQLPVQEEGRGEGAQGKRPREGGSGEKAQGKRFWGEGPGERVQGRRPALRLSRGTQWEL